MVSFSLLSLGTESIIFIVLLVVLIVALLVVPMFTNKKRAKQTEELHNSLQPGDLVKTVGGIIGTIKEIRQISPVDKEMVIETGVGDNKTTMVFDIAALYQVMSRSSSTVAAKTEEEENATEPEAAEDKPEVEPVVATEEHATEEVKPESGEQAVEQSAQEEPAAEQAATEPAAEEVKAEGNEEASDQPAAGNHPAKKPVAKKAGGVKSNKSTKK